MKRVALLELAKVCCCRLVACQALLLLSLTKLETEPQQSRKFTASYALRRSQHRYSLHFPALLLANTYDTHCKYTAILCLTSLGARIRDGPRVQGGVDRLRQFGVALVAAVAVAVAAAAATAAAATAGASDRRR